MLAGRMVALSLLEELPADSAGAGLWSLEYGTGVFWASERARSA